jgi:hypothetical protein
MKKLIFALTLLLPAVTFADHRYVRGVRVTIAPPALRYESPPPAPSPRHQWIAGYWGWRGGKHLWMEGHWALPPRPGYVWEPARWDQDGGAWTFIDGHWRTAEEADPNTVYQPPAPPVTEVTVAEPPPPAPLEEVRPEAPFAGAVWIGGEWHWNGTRYVWMAGRWSAQPGGHVWEAAKWEKRGGKYVHRPGHWRRR